MYHLWRKTAAVFLFSSLLALPAFAAEKAVSADVAEVAAVEVTGSRLAESTADVPAQTYVITREDIDNSAARDVQDVLSNVPGVNGLLNSASMAQDKYVSVRGLTTEVLLLVDGVPYMGTNYGTGSMGNPFDLRGISLTDVDHIEIVKGAGSAIYGSNAAGGVINIITRKPTDKSAGSMTVEGGNKEWFRGNVRGTVLLSNDLRVFAGYTRTQEGETKIKLVDPAGGLYDYGREFRGDDYSFGFTKGPWAFKAELGDYKSEWDNTYGVSTANDKQKNEYKRFLLNYADGVNTGRLYYYDNKRDYTYNYTDPMASITHYIDKVFGATYNRKQELGTLPFVFGMDFRHENGNVSVSTFTDDMYDKSRNEYAPYIETSIPIGDAAFDIGLRYEYWDIDGGEDAHEFIPRFSLNWANKNGLMYYVTAGRYFSMPSFYHIFGDESSWVIGNSNLKPEKGWTYDIGVKDDTAKNPWSFNIFYMNMEDKINYTYRLSGSMYEGQYINVDEYRAWGFDGQYKWNFHENWSYTQGLSYLHAEENTGSSDWERSDMPRWDISGILNFKNDPWSAELSAHYYGDRQLKNAVYDDEDIFIVNAAVSWKVDRTTIKLACVNLFDKEFYLNNSGYINPERRFILSATYEF
ncbi:MAG: TonB-dependent receptor [Synergistaceae bacterium]|nr:TonB-dependent receptor [Synergistaceae bacterium]